MLEFESLVEDNSEDTLGVGGRRGGRTPGRGRFQDTSAIRRTRLDNIDDDEPTYPRLLKPRLDIHPRCCGTH